MKFLGACGEVGRSAVAVEVSNDKYLLLDYGVMMNSEIGFPVHIPPRNVEAIFLSHAHLDHSGLTPLLYLSGDMPIYAVEPTFKLTDLLIRDFIHLSGYYLPYEYIDLESMLDKAVALSHREPVKFHNAEVKLLNAGHIPGSSQVLVESESRILYTGDFNTAPTRLIDSAETELGNLDAIVIEGTYANEDHPSRVELEKEFVSTATQVVEDGGTVLVPAFGVGRSQEVISILTQYDFPYPVYVDGMALKAIRILLNYPEALRSPELFKKAVERVEWINKWKDRRKAAKTPSVIVSPAGMLKGGAAVFYMEQIAREKKNAIILVSYQIPGTPGSILLEKRKFMLHGRSRRVDAQVFRFDFSSHAGRRELHEVLKSLDRGTKVFVVHGEKANCRALSSFAEKELGLEAYAPDAGDEFDV